MAEKLQLSGFDAQWAPVLTDWLGRAEDPPAGAGYRAQSACGAG